MLQSTHTTTHADSPRGRVQHTTFEHGCRPISHTCRAETAVRFGLLGVAIPFLVLMLALSVPAGADDGVHGGALLHTALPHTHGSAAPGLAPSRRPAAFSPDPSFTAGSAPTSELPGAGLTPPLPQISLDLASDGPGWQRSTSDRLPSSRCEPPPDRPPAGLLHDPLARLSVHMRRPVATGDTAA